MKRLLSTFPYAVALILCGADLKAEQPSVAEEFAGTTPGGVAARGFVGGLAVDAPCHSVTWQLTLLTNQSTGGPATFRLDASYHVPTRSNPNRSEDGPKVRLSGTWEMLRTKPKALVYRLHTSQRSVSFIKVGDNLLHLQNPDGSLAIGDGGASYTLNQVRRAEKPGDEVLAMSAPSISYKISPLAKGPTVFGVFEGRTPCQGIARQLGLPQSEGCIKAKWRVTLYRNPETSLPTTYKIEGSLFRDRVREGNWSMVHGATIDAQATVYQLHEAQGQPTLFLLKGDDNVLFFLTHGREPQVGHAEFSYTLNRVLK